MMTGQVSAERLAVVRASVKASESEAGSDEAIDFIIDTYFDGYLSLPPALIERLELPYYPQETCRFCRAENRHCFELHIVDDVMVACSNCQTKNGLNADDKTSAACVNCGETVPFPADLINENFLTICYECLRAGRAAMSKYSLKGLIRWQEAQGHEKNNTELLPEEMWELLRTPDFFTWQDTQWKFDQGHPMIFMGDWDQAAFNAHAPDGNGKAFLRR